MHLPKEKKKHIDSLQFVCSCCCGGSSFLLHSRCWRIYWTVWTLKKTSTWNKWEGRKTKEARVSLEQGHSETLPIWNSWEEDPLYMWQCRKPSLTFRAELVLCDDAGVEPHCEDELWRLWLDRSWREILLTHKFLCLQMLLDFFEWL